MIPDGFGFALLLSVIGQENSRHHLNQSNAKLEPFPTQIFQRRFPVFTSSSHWLMIMIIFVLIGSCGCGFSTLDYCFIGARKISHVNILRHNSHSYALSCICFSVQNSFRYVKSDSTYTWFATRMQGTFVIGRRRFQGLVSALSS